MHPSAWLILALLAASGTALGWSSGHQWIRSWAVSRLPDWQKQYFDEDDLRNLSEKYTSLQDLHAAGDRPDLDSYCQPPGTDISLHDVNSNVADTANGIQWYSQQIEEHMKAGRNDQTMKFLGVLCHWMEDPGSPSAHSSPIGEIALRQLMPPPREWQNMNYLYGVGWIDLEGNDLKRAGKTMIPDLPHAPRLLGSTIPEASFTLTVLQQRLRDNASRYIVPLIQARVDGDQETLHELVSQVLLFNARLIADVIYTAGCLANGTIHPEEVKALGTMALSECVAHPPHGLTSHPYYVVQWLVNQAMDDRRNLHRLEFAGGGPMARIEQGFGAGTPTSLQFQLAPGGVYRQLRVRVGLHPTAGPKGKIVFEVLVNDVRAARSEPMAPRQSPVELVADLPNEPMNRLTLQTIAVTGSDPEHNLAVWGDPVLVR